MTGHTLVVDLHQAAEHDQDLQVASTRLTTILYSSMHCFNQAPFMGADAREQQLRTQKVAKFQTHQVAYEYGSFDRCCRVNCHGHTQGAAGCCVVHAEVKSQTNKPRPFLSVIRCTNQDTVVSRIFLIHHITLYHLFVPRVVSKTRKEQKHYKLHIFTKKKSYTFLKKTTKKLVDFQH